MAVTQEDIARAGVVGAGGAGFPTHIKLSGKAETVVLNAAECEPLLHKDKELILRDAPMIVEGLERAMSCVGAKNAVVGVKAKYAKVIEAMNGALRSNMRVSPLPDVYPSGDEFILVYLTLGRVIAPGAIPLSVGAVVMNVETARNVANVEITPVVDKYVSIAGAVANPCTVCVPLGCSLAECLKLAGGATVSNPAYVVGGAMMGRLVPNLDVPVTKTTGGLIVLPEDHFIVQRKSWDWNKTMRVGRAACDQCSRCTELCPRYMLGHPIEPHRAMRSLGFNVNREADVMGTQFCSECNLCSYSSCPEGLDPRGVNHQNKTRLIAEKKRWTNPPFEPSRAELLLPYRKTPTGRLMKRIGLDGFVNHGPLLEKLYQPNEVLIALRQHIGAPCPPVVNKGDVVTRGQAIAVRPTIDGKVALGADIHASITGTIVEISADYIKIAAVS
ncbi:MAG: SLBB domain-containing protein, partial [Thermoguttaceae bacterium]|nr:SLBB domain-containing protein [Thermoguttaceae bacterium]